MNCNRTWSILSWNVCGINSQAKWDHVRNKVVVSGANIVCLQETKRDDFDMAYFSKFCPRHLNQFAFFPSVRASGGLFVIWNGEIFVGDVCHQNSYAITIKFKVNADGTFFHLSNIYGPSAPNEKAAFVHWIYNLDYSSFDDWILVGDFYFIRSPKDRNKPGGLVDDMLTFNDIIQHLDVIDIPFEGRRYTWSNMQEDPLLEKLDWVFTSITWNLTYPGTKTSFEANI